MNKTLLAKTYHYDVIDAPKSMISKFEKTPEGYLKGRASVTNIGVFSYLNEDGTIRRELRLPQEVFSKESLDSLKMKPITNNHPSVAVVAGNIKDYQVGMTGDIPSRSTGFIDENLEYMQGDGLHLSIDMVITDMETVKGIEDGKRGLSCGYFASLEKADDGAIWMGIPYDYIQRDIRYNHVAIVDKGRAGDAARIIMDSSKDFEILIGSDLPKNNNYREDNMPAEMKNITLDGVEYQAEAEVIKTLNKVKNDNVELKTKLDDSVQKSTKIQAERDTLKDRVDQLEKELEKAKEDSVNSDELQIAVTKRLNIIDAAKKVGVEIKGDESDSDLQKAIILKVTPEAKLDEKDDIYIQARFDATIEFIKEDIDDTNAKLLNTNLLQLQKNDGKEDKLNSDEARKRMIASYGKKE